MPCDPRYTTLAASSKLVILSISGRFRGLYNQRFSGPGRVLMPCDPTHDSSGVDKTRDFEHFWPFSWIITHDFRSREDFDAL